MAYEESFDVTLVVQGNSFMVHKFALVAGSPVFATMFEYDTPENQTELVTIDDCDVGTFVTFLEYLYTGTVTEDISFDDAVHLYHTALKYDVQGLKQSCLEALQEKMTVKNVTHAVELARHYNEVELMSCAMNFFDNNFDEIFSETAKEMEPCLKSFDVILVIQQEIYMAHKSVLVAGSPVFARMFKCGMSESQIEILRIDDFDISFNDALQLYHFADKYGMQVLKQSCVQSLQKKMTIKNVTDAVEFARQYKEVELMSCAMNFFKKNFDEICSLTVKEMEPCYKF